MSENEAFA
jgi:hypothetical protein